MRKIKLFICTTLIAITGIAQAPAGYYDSANGLSGENLREALYQIIKNHSSQSYTSLWTAFQTTDKKSNGKVWDMYSDVPGGTSSYQFTFTTNQCGNYSAEGDCYNKEHSFPKSWFSDATPMYSDLFHIYPTDGWVNGKRGNYPYGEVATASWTSTNGSKLGSSATAGYSGTVFEPIDEYKGDFARTYFYMVTRYKNVASGWSSVMLSGNNLSSWAIDMLLAWDDADPVSQKEIDRNNAVYNIQNNRNPYIDQPSYVEYVWGGQTPTSINEITTTYSMEYKSGVLQIEADSDKFDVLVLNMLGEKLLEDNNRNTNVYRKNVDLVPGVYIIVVNGIGRKLSVQ